MDVKMPEQAFSQTFRADEFVDAIAARPRGEAKEAAPLLAVAFSALESNLWGGGVAILDGVTGQRLCGSQLATGVSSVAWTGDDNDLLVCGCDNGDVQLVRLEKSEDSEFVLVPVATPTENSQPGHDDVVTAVAASIVEKNIIASTSWDLTVKVWDANAMETSLTTLDGHSGLIWDVSMSPNQAHILATASQDATVQLWDDRDVVQAANSTLSTRSAALAVEWHPSKDHLIAVGLENGSVLTFDTRVPQSRLSTLAIHEGAIHCIKYSTLHRDLLAVGSDDTSVSLIHGSESADARIQNLDAGHGDYVRALEWYSSPGPTGSDRSVVATGAWDHVVSSWIVSDP